MVFQIVIFTLLRTIRSLKVFVYTDAAFTAAYLTIVSLVILNNHLFPMPTYYAVVDGSSLQYIYALVLPMLLWCNRKNTHDQIRSAVDQNMDYSIAFNALRDQWNHQNVPTETRTPSLKILAHVKHQFIKGRIS
ncbi:hypothetical protein COOONC_08096 [Cooperia oncophora]